MRQLLTESALLALLGAVPGVLLAIAAGNLLIGLMPPFFGPVSLSITADWRVLTFACRRHRVDDAALRPPAGVAGGGPRTVAERHAPQPADDHRAAARRAGARGWPVRALTRADRRRRAVRSHPAQSIECGPRLRPGPRARDADRPAGHRVRKRAAESIPARDAVGVLDLARRAPRHAVDLHAIQRQRRWQAVDRSRLRAARRGRRNHSGQSRRVRGISMSSSSRSSRAGPSTHATAPAHRKWRSPARASRAAISAMRRPRSAVTSPPTRARLPERSKSSASPATCAIRIYGNPLNGWCICHGSRRTRSGWRRSSSCSGRRDLR